MGCDKRERSNPLRTCPSALEGENAILDRDLDEGLTTVFTGEMLGKMPKLRRIPSNGDRPKPRSNSLDGNNGRRLLSWQQGAFGATYC